MSKVSLVIVMLSGDEGTYQVQLRVEGTPLLSNQPLQCVSIEVEKAAFLASTLAVLVVEYNNVLAVGHGV